MQYALASALSLLAVSAPLTLAAPTSEASTPNAQLQARYKLENPTKEGTTTCKYNSEYVVGEWVYQARIWASDLGLDEFCSKMEEAAKGADQTWCGNGEVTECAHDINNPQIKKWKFNVISECDDSMIAGAIEEATSQEDISCDLDIFPSDE